MSDPESAAADVSSALATLANGIIPADARDAGAAAVNAGSQLAKRIVAGVHAALYQQGVGAAESLARTRYGVPPGELNSERLHDLLFALQEQQPAFFRQLRMDVCALYLSDSDVAVRIGFPGPSIESGGYPDFDQPQS